MTGTYVRPKVKPIIKNRRRRKKISLDSKKSRAGFLFVLPFVLGLILIYLPIVLDSLSFSVNTIKAEIIRDPSNGQIIGGGYRLEWIGFEHYQKAFANTEFKQVLITGLKELVFDIPAIVIFSLFVAVLLNKKMLGRAAFRAIFFIPVILSTGLVNEIASMGSAANSFWGSSGTVDDGSGEVSTMESIVSVTDLSWLFDNMAIGTELLEYVTGIVNDIYNIINRSGVQMLIFLAGLQSISPAIYESCSIDGATGWETFWKITFPMVSPIILVNSIYTVIDAFTSSDNTIMKFINNSYTSAGGGREVATAMSWIYFAIVIGIVLIVSAFLSAYIFYQKRD